MTDFFDKLYINGLWCTPHSSQTISLQNPATLQTFAHVPAADTVDLNRAVDAADAAAPLWAAVPLAQRIAKMQTMLEHFRAHHDRIIELEAQELGSPVRFSKYAHCEQQFDRTESFIEAAKSVDFEREFAKSTVLREPYGVVACITPWNYPLGQIVQKVIPALLTGNTVVIKPSQHTPLTAYLFVDAFDRAGFPPGVVNLITGRGSELGNALASHPKVAMISFTGSTKVGIELSREALLSMKRVSLELGGKSPYIWMPSANYEKALPKLVSSIFYNSGQTCTSLSRLIVPAQDLARIEPLIKAAAEKLVLGDPMDPTTDLGPVASRAQFEKISDYIALGIQEGATLLTGGMPDEPKNGYYIRPTIFTHVTNAMRIAREEIFGPVLCVLTYETLDEAVAIANDTPYGLNAAVYGPPKEAQELARRIQSGNIYINDAPRDMTAPFGGYKQSGIGREGGIEGLREFTQLKAIFNHASF